MPEGILFRFFFNLVPYFVRITDKSSPFPLKGVQENQENQFPLKGVLREPGEPGEPENQKSKGPLPRVALLLDLKRSTIKRPPSKGGLTSTTEE